MASIVVSPIVTGKKSALVANTETKEEKINFEIFSEKPNLLEYSFSFLHGYEVAQLGTISKHINWRSRTEYLWIELYGNEFGNYKHVFKNLNAHISQNLNNLFITFIVAKFCIAIFN